jgi:periplasmic protein TonB
MFEQAVLSNGPASKRVWTTFAGVTGQALLVTFAVMIPMIWPEAMPSHQTLLRIFVPSSPPAPLPKGAPSSALATRAVPKPFQGTGLVIPTSRPDRATIIVDPLPAPGEVYGDVAGVVGGTRNGVPGGVPDLLRSLTAIVAPARPMERVPAPAPAETAAPARIRAGGLVVLGEPIRRVEPLYPRIAIAARISGTVELEGVVGVDGRIRELKVKKGHPILAPAAVEAVRQWIYRPTTLNGDPVEVIAPISVTFRLN